MMVTGHTASPDAPTRAADGASNGTRTRDIQDHNLALYQLSYARHPGGGFRPISRQPSTLAAAPWQNAA
jgi:hypothetical protein